MDCFIKLDSNISWDKKGSISELEFTENYKNALSNLNESNIREIYSMREYKIPVLNRGDTLEFACLTTSTDSQQPTLWIDCEHEGLKMKFKTLPPNYIWNEPQPSCALCGLLSAIIVIPLIMTYVSSVTWVAVWSFLYGAFLILPGVIIYKMYKKIKAQLF